MSSYGDSDFMRVALEKYFRDNGFARDGGYSDDWVKIKVGPIPFMIPNNAARKRAVPHHDLHHIVTAYDTSFRGEAEIGAWEVASGCADHYAAWLLNLMAMSQGLLFWPRHIYRAFVRGRYTQNTYRMSYGPELLDESVAALRARLGLDDANAEATTQDKVAFALWAVASLTVGFATLALYAAPVVGVLWVALWLI